MITFGIFFSFIRNIQNLGMELYKIDNKSGSFLFALPFLMGVVSIPLIGMWTDKFGCRP